MNRTIYIKNIYYMLAYAFRELRQCHYESIAGEKFDNVYELLSEILIRGVSYQLKQGLHKEYVPKHESLMTVKGRINITETLHDGFQRKMTVFCDYDDLSENCLFNSILKTTMNVLLTSMPIKDSQRKELKKLLLFFADVETVDTSRIKWMQLRFDRNTQTYKILLYICYFVLDGMLLSTEKGKFKMMTFSDEHMCRLYEKFILEYYRQEHPETKARAKQIEWNIDKDVSSQDILPVLKTDVFLTLRDRILIIDAKYYMTSMQTNFDRHTIHSQNLYQILAYVLNEDGAHEVRGEVDGMLLYAKTDEEIVPDGKMKWKDGATIFFRNLDLGVDFEKIKSQLDSLIEY